MKRRPFSRRKFLQTAATATGALAARAGAGEPAPAKPKRNVIVIVSDTMRRDALGCYGGDWIQTPFLDAFARRAIRCDNAYLCSFPTVPTRHDLLTGRYTFTYKPWSPLDADTVTLQDVLRANDVYTSLIVDTPHPFRPEYDYQRRFDHAQVNRGQENDAFKTEPVPVQMPCEPRKLRGGEAVVTQYLRNVADRKVEEDYFCARTCRDAATWLERNHRRQPFFLYVDTFDPHEPWDPPKAYVDKYDPDYSGQDVIYPRYARWRDFLSDDELKHCRALYAGEASLVDRWVGHLLETIEKLGLLENSLVVFLADHGFYLGEHGYIGKAYIADGKFQSLPLYGEVCRVPFLVHFPGCAAGGSIDALVQHVSLARTISDFLGLRDVPDAFQGPSLWPVLQGHEEQATPIAISSPNLSHAGMKQPHPANRASIADGRWLLIYGSAGSGDPSDTTASVDSSQREVAPLTGEKLAPELYDLKSDPGCATNVIAGHKEVAGELHARFVEFLERSPMRRDHLAYFQKI
ncbi:MAG TPA: sulfatase [Pirellulales bacterium]|nr:sulfatase [Pirellulales bacterium]